MMLGIGNPRTSDPLEGLRGYHLPEAISWWPPAPGWWLLGGLSLATLIGLVWWIRRRSRRGLPAKAALSELTQLRNEHAAGGDTAVFVRELSKLLRRFAIAVFPSRDVASLTGDDWLRFLDAHGGDGRFLDGCGRQLTDAPYRRDAEVSIGPLADLAADWIQHNRERCP